MTDYRLEQARQLLSEVRANIKCELPCPKCPRQYMCGLLRAANILIGKAMTMNDNAD